MSRLYPGVILVVLAMVAIEYLELAHYSDWSDYIVGFCGGAGLVWLREQLGGQWIHDVTQARRALLTCLLPLGVVIGVLESDKALPSELLVVKALLAGT